MPDYIGPYGLVLLRVITASFLFFLLKLLFPEKNRS